MTTPITRDEDPMDVASVVLPDVPRSSAEVEPTDPRFDILTAWLCVTLPREQLLLLHSAALATLDDIQPPRDGDPTIPHEDALMGLCSAIDEALATRNKTINERATKITKKIRETVQMEQSEIMPLWQVIHDELAAALDTADRWTIPQIVE